MWEAASSAKAPACRQCEGGREGRPYGHVRRHDVVPLLRARPPGRDAAQPEEGPGAECVRVLVLRGALRDALEGAGKTVVAPSLLPPSPLTHLSSLNPAPGARSAGPHLTPPRLRPTVLQALAPLQLDDRERKYAAGAGFSLHAP